MKQTTLKKETMELLYKEMLKDKERVTGRGRKADIVYLPCLVEYGTDGNVGCVTYPSSQTIFNEENK